MFRPACGTCLRTGPWRALPATLAAIVLALTAAVGVAGCGSGSSRPRPRPRSPGSRKSNSSRRATAPSSAAWRSSSRSTCGTSSLAPAPFRRRTAARRGQHPLQPQPRPRLRRPGQARTGGATARSARGGLSAPPSTPRSTPARTGSSASGSASTGSYSPATRPEIFYTNLRPGFYRLVATLAANDGATTPFHDVTSFQILRGPGPRDRRLRRRQESPAPRPPRAAD